MGRSAVNRDAGFNDCMRDFTGIRKIDGTAML